MVKTVINVSKTKLFQSNTTVSSNSQIEGESKKEVDSFCCLCSHVANAVQKNPGIRRKMREAQNILACNHTYRSSIGEPMNVMRNQKAS